MRIQEEIKKTTVQYVLAGFGFVAGLAWNEAIKGLIDSVLPEDAGLVAKFAYAVAATLLVVFMSLYVVRRR